MMSSEALHLGPLMLPWALLLMIVILLSVAMLGRFLAKQQQWHADVKQHFQESLWTSLWIGLLGARLIFILLYWDVYLASPMDILKVQDKGFHLLGGIVSGGAWFVWKNKALSKQNLLMCIALFVILLSLGLWLKQSLKSEVQYPALSFSAIQQTHLVEDSQVNLQQFIGKPTVINLWASWCPPCHREMPVLQQAHDKHPNIQFILLNQGEENSAVAAYLQRYNLNFKHVLLDPHGEMPQQMNMFGLPSTLFFNAQGQLIDRHMGELNAAMLAQYLQKISQISTPKSQITQHP